MKAVLYNQYGAPDVLYIDDVPMPEPKADEVLIRVRAAGINPTDAAQRAGQFKAFTGKEFPKRTGCDVAGNVVQIGVNVTHLKVGDAVYGMTVDFKQMGTAAEYVVMNGAYVALKPQSLSYEQAAALPLAAETALQGLRDHGGIAVRMRVCINGAAGGVGLLAVQIAKAYGAHVTVICSAASADLVRQYGADAIIDYAKNDVKDLRETFDLFFDCRGTVRWADIKHALGQSGRYVTIAPNFLLVLQSALSTRFGQGRIRAFFVKSQRSDLDIITAWADAGKLRPHIAQVYPLEQVADAHRQIETKHTHGKLVLIIQS